MQSILLIDFKISAYKITVVHQLSEKERKGEFISQPGRKEKRNSFELMGIGRGLFLFGRYY
jgi:hypothetical protein